MIRRLNPPPCRTIGAALLAGAAVLLSAVASPALAAPRDDVNYFKVSAVGTGTARANYGTDGKDPTLTTSSGVDGAVSAGWRWEVRAVAKSVGDGPLRPGPQITRARAFEEVSLVSYSVQMGEYDETKICGSRHGKNVSVSADDRDPPPGVNSRGEYYKAKAKPFRGIIRGSLFVYSTNPLVGLCYHGVGHGDELFDGLEDRRDARVPRGAFNPRFDRSYHHVYESPRFSFGRDHDTDPNQAHTYEGQSRVEVRIDAVSKRRYRRLGDDYNAHPSPDLLPHTHYNTPPPASTAARLGW